mmetsp:Transcript_6446/g.26165  ORF Transcript_6446/g.26165 Transcript_6446/m.26165 type:complete len:208 (-) Transcript_6446:1285-1908(-)
MPSETGSGLTASVRSPALAAAVSFAKASIPLSASPSRPPRACCASWWGKTACSPAPSMDASMVAPVTALTPPSPAELFTCPCCVSPSETFAGATTSLRAADALVTLEAVGATASPSPRDASSAAPSAAASLEKSGPAFSVATSTAPSGAASPAEAGAAESSSLFSCFPSCSWMSLLNSSISALMPSISCLRFSMASRPNTLMDVSVQ